MNHLILGHRTCIQVVSMWWICRGTLLCTWISIKQREHCVQWRMKNSLVHFVGRTWVGFLCENTLKSTCRRFKAICLNCDCIFHYIYFARDSFYQFGAKTEAWLGEHLQYDVRMTGYRGRREGGNSFSLSVFVMAAKNFHDDANTTRVTRIKKKWTCGSAKFIIPKGTVKFMLLTLALTS